MTLEQKIDRLRREAIAQQVKPRYVTPLMARGLWRFGWDVPPPVLWPSWANAVQFAIIYAVIVFSFNLIPYFHDPSRGIGHYVFNIVFFGVGMAWLTPLFPKRKVYTPWYAE